MIFVGECRSPTAVEKGWTWKNGRLAAKPLFEALASMGVDPSAQTFINLWCDPPRGQMRAERPRLNSRSLTRIRLALAEGYVVVAMGWRVSSAMAKIGGLDHVAIVHPAARGRIRKRERYIAHVTSTLRRVA